MPAPRILVALLAASVTLGSFAPAAQAAITPPPGIDVAVVGDSLTYGAVQAASTPMMAQAKTAGLSVYPVGIIGSTTQSQEENITAISAVRPRSLVIALGTNNVAQLNKLADADLPAGLAADRVVVRRILAGVPASTCVAWVGVRTASWVNGYSKIGPAWNALVKEELARRGGCSDYLDWDAASAGHDSTDWFQWEETHMTPLGSTHYGAAMLAKATAMMSRFTPITPLRVLDTRTALGGHAAPFKAGEGFTLKIGGTKGIPTDATAVALNVTVISEAGSVGWALIHPSGAARPSPASNVNWSAGDVIPAATVAKLGSDGAINLYSSAGPTHFIIDVAGWYGATGSSVASAVAPAWILDTRASLGAPTAPISGKLDVTVAGKGGIPLTAQAAILNVTAVDSTQPTFITAWPAGEPRPLTSNLNPPDREAVANLVTVKVGAGGKVSLYNAFGHTNLIVDVVGYYSHSGVGAVVSSAPRRVLDTREDASRQFKRLGVGEAIVVKAGPSMPVGARGAVVNLTATDSTGGSYLTAYAAGSTRPWPTSNLNPKVGRSVGNLAVVPVSADGSFEVFNGIAATHLVIDVQGWVTSLT